ncbi:hypothetical protein [Kribbella soli]|uniref:Uncharacterized protein n=1 Tax=Kribbella soli TaxID=1124743 RepID=A0A4R0HHK8_9ACTN|nr:hypothetical protein [Kribbella soli]TCC08442.1 hypothetical protein E0H45_21425 [Kribbella soli]
MTYQQRAVSRRWVRTVAGLSLIAAMLSAGQAVRGAAPAAAAGPGSLTLHVASARSVNSGPGFVHENDPVPHYKWLINVDDTGDPGTRANQLTDRCLPATATGGSSDPDYADTCPWPSTRPTSGFAPIVAQGTEAELNDGTALSNLPPGKYLISVTADGSAVDVEATGQLPLRIVAVRNHPGPATVTGTWVVPSSLPPRAVLVSNRPLTPWTNAGATAVAVLSLAVATVLGARSRRRTADLGLPSEPQDLAGAGTRS